MSHPFQPLLDRCAKGYTRPQKVCLTLASILWIVSPFDFDFIPILGWIDDVALIVFLRAMWKGPTLPWPPPGAGAALKEVGTAALSQFVRRMVAEAKR